MILTTQKPLFSLPDDVRYLNCAYMSPLPKSVEEAGIAGVRRKSLPYAFSTADFFDTAREVREKFARLVGGSSWENISILPSASYGMAIVVRNLKAQAGQNIVVPQDEFPSVVYACQRFCDENAVELRFVARPQRDELGGSSMGERWNAALLEAIGAKTAMVALSPTHWADGTLFDLRALRARTREVGAAFVVDGTQCVGAMPFDASEIQPDALVCASYKWMFGPYGIGCALWGEYFEGGEPIEENWINRLNSEDFSRLVDYQKEYQPGMGRYNMGEQSNFILLPMLSKSLDCLLEWTPSGISAYCAQLTERFCRAALELGYDVELAPRRSNHLFGVRLGSSATVAANEWIPRAQAECARRKIFLSVRGDALRISPNVYNTEDDMDALIEALRVARG